MRVKPNYAIKLQLSPFPDDVDKGHAGWWMVEFKSKLVQRTQLRLHLGTEFSLWERKKNNKVHLPALILHSLLVRAWPNNKSFIWVNIQCLSSRYDVVLRQEISQNNWNRNRYATLNSLEGRQATFLLSKLTCRHKKGVTADTQKSRSFFTKWGKAAILTQRLAELWEMQFLWRQNCRIGLKLWFSAVLIMLAASHKFWQSP